MRQRVILTILAAAVSACSDEIDFDYNTVEPLPVIEAYVEGGEVWAKVTTTRDVADSTRAHFIDDAEILLTGPGGAEYAVPLVGDGAYRRRGVRCVEGGVYTLSVGIGGETYAATDTMGMAPDVVSGGFTWEEIIQSDVVTYHYVLRTPADSLTNYVITMWRNGQTYRWRSFTNYSAYDGEIEGRVMCFSRDDLEGKDGSDPDDVIQDGDKVEVSVAGISRRVGDYYEALDKSGSTNANPAWTFSGRALGVFSARSVVRLPDVAFSIDALE